MTLLAPTAPSAFVNRRRFERFSLRPMYTAVSVRRNGEASSLRLDGHAYDIGEGGVNIEIDEPIVAGEPIEIEIDLPGCARRIAAQGRVVRCEDDPDDVLGPCRLAVKFEGFASDLDLPALRRYLGEGWLMRAA
ncbi:MAG: PilZ domain-containing protein [Phycisphaerales bacterium]|jgi:hypothetical protein